MIHMEGNKTLTNLTSIPSSQGVLPPMSPHVMNNGAASMNGLPNGQMPTQMNGQIGSHMNGGGNYWDYNNMTQPSSSFAQTFNQLQPLSNSTNGLVLNIGSKR